jgi:hypothetical protein
VKPFTLAVLLLSLNPLEAQVTIQNFDGFADNTALTNQIPGLTFTGGSVYTAGISLNDAQYPPHSGAGAVTNAATNSVTITFATPIPIVRGYYTYSGALTVQAFNASAVQVASATSLYSNNTALNGAAGSTPNELITVYSAGGIASITITSAAGVNSFTLDDLSYGAIPVPTISVPAMGGLVFLLALAGCLAAGRQARAGGMAALTLLMFATVPHPAHASPGPAFLYLSPSNIALNTPTPVTFTCIITDPQALADTVTLIRTDTTPPTLIGPMTFTGSHPIPTMQPVALAGRSTTMPTTQPMIVTGATYVLNGTVTITPSNPIQTFSCTVGRGLSTLRAKSANAFAPSGPV